MNIICFIFARGNSKGLKNKNLLKFKKTTLLGNAILQARKVKYAKRTFVSTDSKQIMLEAKRYKAEIPFLRPKYLASDNSPEILSWRHAINYLDKNLNLRPDYIVSVPTTSPLRNVSDINKCVRKAIRNKLDMVYTVTPSARNPYFNMFVEKGGKLNIISKTGGLVKNFKSKKIYRRQEAPNCFDLTTVCYVFKPDFVMKTNDMFSGKIGFVKIPKQRTIDIDDEFDYKIVNFLSSEQLK